MTCPVSRSAVIVNPRAANGRVERRWDEIEAVLRRHLGEPEFLRTKAPGDGIRLAAEAVAAGFTRIGSLGGDGTHSEVVNGLLDEQGRALNPEVCLSVLPVGTGGDFRRTLDIGGKDLDTYAREMARGDATAIDVGAVEFRAADGTRARRCFVNIGSFGLAGTVDEIVNTSTKFFGGKVTFMMGTLRGMLRFSPPTMRVRVDGDIVFEGRGMSVSVANGRYFGGGMKIAPDADPRDGLFDVVVVPWVGRLHHAVTGARVYRGKHLGRDGVFAVRGREVEVEADSECLIDLDGEMVGSTPATCRVLPGVIRVTGLRAR